MKNFRFIYACVAVSLVFLYQNQISAQEKGEISSITAVIGADSIEEISEEELIKFQDLSVRKLKINLVSASKLASSGLLTPYQVASLVDYRKNSGDVLSFEELSLIDGFNREIVEKLMPFISFQSAANPGYSSVEKQKCHGEVLAKGGYKYQSDKSLYSWGVRNKFEIGDRLEIGFSSRSAYDTRLFPPNSNTFSVAWYGLDKIGKIIVGDFNARFGQGLLIWSGSFMNNPVSLDNIEKKATGFSPCWSFSGTSSHRGLATDFRIGKMILSAGMFMPGIRPWIDEGKPFDNKMVTILNLTYPFANAQVSVTAIPAYAYSADLRYCKKGINLFCETAYYPKYEAFAAIIGTSFPISEKLSCSVLLRGYPKGYENEYASALRSWSKTSDEYGSCVGIKIGNVRLSADYATKSDFSKMQTKIKLKFPIKVSERLTLNCLLNERIRDYDMKFRTEARVDVSYTKNYFLFNLRLNALKGKSYSGLSYIESGFKNEKYSIWIRGCGFIADNWDDRIYAYERDAPGNFTVPAYYGRGLSFSLYLGGKFPINKGKHRLRLYARVSDVLYPFMEQPKPSRFESKIQVVYDF